MSAPLNPCMFGAIFELYITISHIHPRAALVVCFDFTVKEFKSERTTTHRNQNKNNNPMTETILQFSHFTIDFHIFTEKTKIRNWIQCTRAGTS